METFLLIISPSRKSHRKTGSENFSCLAIYWSRNQAEAQSNLLGESSFFEALLGTMYLEIS
jgi:hypothetical protein